MPEEQNTALVRRMIEAGNRREIEAMIACYAPEIVNHGRTARREDVEHIWRNLLEAFPDYHLEVDLLFAGGDWVAAYLMMSGTHQGSPARPVLGGVLSGVAPAGAGVTVPHIHLYRIQDGQIVEHRALRDDLGMMRQLGLLSASS